MLRRVLEERRYGSPHAHQDPHVLCVLRDGIAVGSQRAYERRAAAAAAADAAAAGIAAQNATATGSGIAPGDNAFIGTAGAATRARSAAAPAADTRARVALSARCASRRHGPK